MAGYVPLIFYQQFSYLNIITQAQFQIYASLNTAANILCIVSFVIYVSDVNVDDTMVSRDDNFNQLIEDPK